FHEILSVTHPYPTGRSWRSGNRQPPIDAACRTDPKGGSRHLYLSSTWSPRDPENRTDHSGGNEPRRCTGTADADRLPCRIMERNSTLGFLREGASTLQGSSRA